MPSQIFVKKEDYIASPTQNTDRGDRWVNQRVTTHELSLNFLQMKTARVKTTTTTTTTIFEKGIGKTFREKEIKAPTKNGTCGSYLERGETKGGSNEIQVGLFV